MFETLENRRMFDASVPNITGITDETQGTITEHMTHENQQSENSQYSSKPRQMAGQDGQES